MELKPQMVVKLVLESVVVYGRVISVDENGDAQVRFNNNGTVLVSTVIPEMVSEAFYFTGKQRYGV